MAKTVVKGSSYNNASQPTIYTAPSDKYAKVTVVYFGCRYHNYGDGDSYVPHMWINGTSTNSAGDNTQVIKGNMPYTGAMYSGTSWRHASNGAIGLEGAFLVPPSALIRIQSMSYEHCSYYLLIEEIAKTTVEA